MTVEFIKNTYTSGTGILVFPDHYVAYGQVFAQNHSLAVTVGTKKIVKAGTIFPSNDDHAQGIVLNDLDVTNGDVNGAVIIHGFVKTAALPTAPSTAARLAMKAIFLMPFEADTTIESLLAYFGALTVTAEQLNNAGGKAATSAQIFNLGAPVIADADRLVVSTNMKNGAYTVAAQPDIPRNVTVATTAVGTADTQGTITVVGTDMDDEALTEVITPLSGTTVAGIKAFKTITSITGAGWAIDAVEGTNDTIKVGIGNELGLPLSLSAATKVMFALLGTTVTASNATVTTPATLAGTTVDLSAGTYNGTKEVVVALVN